MGDIELREWLRKLIRPGSPEEFHEGLEEAAKRRALRHAPEPEITEADLADIDRLVWRLSGSFRPATTIPEQPVVSEMAAQLPGEEAGRTQVADFRPAIVLRTAFVEGEQSVVAEYRKSTTGFTIRAYRSGDEPHSTWLAARLVPDAAPVPPLDSPAGTEPSPVELLIPGSSISAAAAQLAWVWGTTPTQQPLFLICVQLSTQSNEQATRPG